MWTANDFPTVQTANGRVVDQVAGLALPLSPEKDEIDLPTCAEEQ
jgi:hypothetical protein